MQNLKKSLGILILLVSVSMVLKILFFLISDGKPNAVAIALSVVGGVLLIGGIIAAVVVVKKTPKKLKKQVGPQNVDEATTAC